MQNIMLMTPTDLGDKARAAISGTINPLIADAFALYLKTKNFHWHLSGLHFRDLHLLFDEQAEQIFNMIDILAERVRKIGGTTIHSVSEVSRLQRIKDDHDEFVAEKEMVLRLLKDNQQFLTNMRVAHSICDEYHDIATASLLENFVDETERRIWFLFETQAG